MAITWNYFGQFGKKKSVDTEYLVEKMNLIAEK